MQLAISVNGTKLQRGNQLTRYIEAFSWTDSIDKFVREMVIERPILNVCSGRVDFGDIKADLYEPSDVRTDMVALPFADNSFGCVFCDPPWDASMKRKIASFCAEALRVAPVLYLMSPWHWGSSKRRIEKIWLREYPGITNAILIIKYVRK